jgi:hypothetical protein
METRGERVEEVADGRSAHLTSLFRLCEKTGMDETSACPKCGKPTVRVVRDSRVTPVCSLCDTPDRVCTWCKVPMTKRLVADGKFLHYLCPKCVFQHTTKFAAT